MNWIQVIAPPLLMVIGGIITWLIKSRIEELRATEERLDEIRRKTYMEILKPYITLFTDMSAIGQQKVVEAVQSREYKKIAFELNLFGSDQVVLAYNSLIHHTYDVEKTGEQNPKEMLKLWGAFLLEIRKSLGNKNSNLDEWDMLQSMIKDIDLLKK
jgi:hypothetical protein